MLAGLLPALTDAQPTQEEADGGEVPAFSYGPRGLQYESADGNNFLWFGVRLQLRYSNDRILVDEMPGESPQVESEFGVNRGRFKLGGHLVRPALQVYSEYDFVDDRLLDLRATYAFADGFRLRIGQWKSEYNRERIDSSGAQQFVERSVVTPWFTVDRQQGVMASGRVGAGKPHDFSYWFGRLSGAGRGGSATGEDGLWLGRYQWNFTGRELAFSQSDIGRQEAAGSLALAAVSGVSRYTSFSSAGGGQLPGYPAGTDNEYRIEQFMVETAYQSGGFSWQQELHWKNVTDRATGDSRRLLGGYAQAGYFAHESWEDFPAPLELALRFARVDPDRSLAGDMEREWTAVANWFFNSHRNKLSADLSRVRRVMAPETDTDTRLRLQWEISF